MTSQHGPDRQCEFQGETNWCPFLVQVIGNRCGRLKEVHPGGSSRWLGRVRPWPFLCRRL